MYIYLLYGRFPVDPTATEGVRERKYHHKITKKDTRYLQLLPSIFYSIVSVPTELSLSENLFEMRTWSLARRIPRGSHRTYIGTSTPEVTLSLGISRIYRVTYAAIFFATSAVDSSSIVATDESLSFKGE